jgi:hypothetical protein
MLINKNNNGKEEEMSLQKMIKYKQRRSIEVIVLSHENYAHPNRIAVISEIPFLNKLIYLKKKKKKT